MGRAELTSQLSAAAIAVVGGMWYASAGDAGLGLVAVVIAGVAIGVQFTAYSDRTASENRHQNTNGTA
jgi:hypothetical protein